MAIELKSQLQTYFQTGDVPTQQQYYNLIDSQVNLAETGIQTLKGTLSASNFAAQNDITASGNISASGDLSVTGFLSYYYDIPFYDTRLIIDAGRFLAKDVG